MTTSNSYNSDIEETISKRHNIVWNYRASGDGRLTVGHPFSTLAFAMMLGELVVGSSTPVPNRATYLILKAWREDGIFRLAPSGKLYPCYMATTARILCRSRYANDCRLKKIFNHLLEIQHNYGGWRYKKFSFGRGPETEFPNPVPKLVVLDSFRFTQLFNKDDHLDRAVEFLLDHWVTRKPIGPCHFGIGTLFMKVEYPFFRYNIFSMYTCSLFMTEQRVIKDSSIRLGF